ncbi:MAG TPA: hypothetical protein PKV72_05630 [Candidatus Peribacteria bacterium]|nr:hypothetical protein [Candidatus Peribacteria bacterium]
MSRRNSKGPDEDWGLPELERWKAAPQDVEPDPDELAELVEDCFVGVDAPNWRVPVERVRDLLFASLADTEKTMVVPQAPVYVGFQPHPDDPLPPLPQAKKPRLGIEQLEQHR